jgi:molybdenum cofactor synthesis domain-containing protein
VKRPLTAAILTVSDTCSRGAAEDTAGPALGDLLHKLVGAEIVATECVPDEKESIVRVLTAWANDTPRPELILTTGGTGLAPRDVTPEATAQLLERRHPALLELARSRCYPTTPLAALSRGEAGAIAQSLVINLPGSQRGATEMLSALIDVLPHAIMALRGEEDHGPR